MKGSRRLLASALVGSVLAVLGQAQLGQPLYRVGQGVHSDATVSPNLSTIVSVGESAQLPPFTCVSRAPLFNPDQVIDQDHMGYYPVMAPGGGAILDVTPTPGGSFALERKSLTGVVIWKRPVEELAELVPARWGDVVLVLGTQATDAYRASDGVRISSFPPAWSRNLTAISDDGSALLFRHGRTLSLWDTATGQSRWHTQYSEYESVDALGVSGGGRYVAYGTEEYTSEGRVYTLSVVDTATGKSLPTPDWHPYLPQICFSPDGSRYVASLGDAWIIDTVTGATLRQLPDVDPHAAFWSRDGLRVLLVAGGDSAGVATFDADTGALLSRAGSLCSVPGRSPLGDSFLVAQAGGAMRYETSTGHALVSHPQDGWRPAWAFSGAGDVVWMAASGQYQAHFSEFVGSTGRFVGSWTADHGLGSFASPSPGADWMSGTYSTTDTTSVLFNLRLHTMTVAGRYPGQLAAAGFSDDGRWFLCGSQKTLDLIDTTGRVLPRHFEGAFGVHMGLSRDGQWACGIDGGMPTTLRFWRASDMALLSTWTLPNFVTSASWSPEGNVVWLQEVDSLGTPMVQALDWRTGATLFNASDDAHVDQISLPANGQQLLLHALYGWLNVLRNPLAPDPAALPTGVELGRGALTWGSIASLLYHDADWYEIHEGALGTDGSAATLVVNGAKPMASQNLASVTLRFRVPATGREVRVRVYDWAKSTYVQLGSVTSSGAWQEIQIPAGDGSYARPKDGVVRLAVSLIGVPRGQAKTDLLTDRVAFAWR